MNIDLFAGPGGWDLALRQLGDDAIGIEKDPVTCATRAAAGLTTIRADVTTLNPADFAPATGLIGSPPCPTFSSAGRQQGTVRLDHLLAWLNSPSARAARPVSPTRLDGHRSSTWLVVEPLRWARVLRPDWIALEQVPAVLPIWKAIGTHLSTLGYHVACGVLSAERYGLPQTRSRAVLLASRLHPVKLPLATHSRFYAATPSRRDPGTVRWRSMADVTGWPAGQLVGFPRRADTAHATRIGDVSYRTRDLRPAAYPAFAVTEKARSWTRDGQPVTVTEAALLQGFPPHPWQGSRTHQFAQLANAVPPPLAQQLLAAACLPERAVLR